MYILSHIENGKYAVADTKDGVLEYITADEYNRFKTAGVDIEPWDLAKAGITNSLLQGCAYRLFSKAKRVYNDSDIIEYLKGHIIYPLTHIYNTFNVVPDWSKGVKMYDYCDTCGYFIFLMNLTNGQKIVLKVNENNGIYAQIIPYKCNSYFYPCGSGFLYNSLFNRNNLRTQKLIESNVYLMAYSEDLSQIIIIDLTSLGNVGFNSFLIDNYNKTILK